ncbi:MAG: hypothetical protein CMO01_07750 [Thalassobius sp.]|nr:hypothetical protein [Thalassovita sp.]
MRNPFIFLLTVLIISSCDYFKPGSEQNPENGNPVARVGENFLYDKDLRGLVPPRSSSEDSANILNRYIDSWVRKQLILKSAEENTNINEAEIARKMQDYRYQLIVYNYEKRYIQEKLDTAISDDEIQQYYEENRDNFILKQNIIKGILLKVPKEAPQTDRVKVWLRSNSEADAEKLRSYAYTFGDSYLLDDSVWLDFDEYLYNTPFKEEITNPIQTLKRSTLLETSDSTHLYFIKIKDYKISDQHSPVEFVKAQIRDVLINKRIVALRKDRENEIFEKALKNEDYEIYE